MLELKISEKEMSESKYCIIETDVWSQQPILRMIMRFHPKEIEGKKVCLVSSQALLNQIGDSLKNEGFGFDTIEGQESDELNEDCNPKFSENTILAEITTNQEFLSNLKQMQLDMKYESLGELIKDLIREKVATYSPKKESEEGKEFKEFKVKISSELLPLLSYLSIERKKTLEEVLNAFLNYELKFAKDQVDDFTTSLVSF